MDTLNWLDTLNFRILGKQNDSPLLVMSICRSINVVAAVPTCTPIAITSISLFQDNSCQGQKTEEVYAVGEVSDKL